MPESDPNADTTFRRSKLDWGERTEARHARWLRLYTRLLRCRHDHLVPNLAHARSGTWTEPAPGSLRVTWPLGPSRRWHLLAQLADRDGPPALAAALPGQIVYRSDADAAVLRAWSVLASMESP